MKLILSSEDLGEVNSSEFYDFYLKSFVAVRNLPILLNSKTSVFAFITVFLIVGIITYILQFIADFRQDQITSEKFIYDELILGDEKALVELHQASDKCYNKRYSLKCIELVIYWPHLINICLPTSKGITPFHRVCYRGHYSLIDFMISKGANLLQETESGENAFHMVIDYYIRNTTQKNFNCLDLLYEKGCFLKDSEWYKQFVSDAREAKNEDLVQWLESHMIRVRK